MKQKEKAGNTIEPSGGRGAFPSELRLVVRAALAAEVRTSLAGSSTSAAVFCER